MRDNMNYHGEDCVAYKVTGAVLAVIPAILEIDPNTVAGFVLLCICGGAGAILGIAGDRPANTVETIFRVLCGIITCALFGGYIAQRFGYHDDMTGKVMVYGFVGLVSWYVIGSVTKGLARWQQTGGMWEFLKLQARNMIAAKAPNPSPPTEAFPPSMVAESKSGVLKKEGKVT